jgi:hypothetical protein
MWITPYAMIVQNWTDYSSRSRTIDIVVVKPASMGSDIQPHPQNAPNEQTWMLMWSW